MTLQELNENFRLLKQLNKACDMLASLEESATPGSPVLNGLPHAPGYKDKVGELAAEIADMRARVESIENEIKRKRQEIEPFINRVSDDQVRIILRLRFLRGLSWGEVAAAIKASKAKIAQMEAEELEGKMHRSEDVAAMTEDLIYEIRGALIALPGRLAVDVAACNSAAEAAEIMRREVYQIMGELASYQYDPDKYADRVRERMKWEPEFAEAVDE